MGFWKVPGRGLLFYCALIPDERDTGYDIDRDRIDAQRAEPTCIPFCGQTVEGNILRY